jgi:DNA-binding beta-propeller fold protein YncE
MKLVKNLSIALVSTGFMVLGGAAQSLAISLTYDSQIGSPGFGPGQLFVPQGIGVQDETGKVFVSNGRGLNPDGTFNANLGNKVDIFDKSGTYLGAVGSGRQGKGIGFDEPADLKFQPGTGDLHVGDVFNSEIDVYNPNTGDYIRSYASFGGPVEGRIFFGPGGMQFDKNGDLYISDFSQDVLKKYDGKTGDLLQTIGGPGNGLGQFSGPAGLNISQNTGNIYVTDQYNNRVQVLDPNGTPLFAFGSKGSQPGQLSEAIGIELDEFDNIYVADSINSRVQVFDKDGNFLTTYGEPVRDSSGNVVPPPAPGGLPFGSPADLSPGKFNWTAGLHYDQGKLYVGDFFQGRVQVLNVQGQAPATGTKVPEPSALAGLGLLGFVAANSMLKRKRNQKLGEDLLAKVETV